MRRLPGVRITCNSSLGCRLQESFLSTISAHIVLDGNLPLDRKLQLVCQSPESCLLAYRIVTGEYHDRSQEWIVFSQSCLQPFEADGGFTQTEISPCNWQRGALTSTAQHVSTIRCRF
jgi:hypothetical protein